MLARARPLRSGGRCNSLGNESSDFHCDSWPYFSQIDRVDIEYEYVQIYTSTLFDLSRESGPQL